MMTARYSTNRDPNRERTLARSNQPRTSETYRRQGDVFGYELQRRLSYVLPNQKCHHKRWQKKLALGGLHEDKLCDISQTLCVLCEFSCHLFWTSNLWTYQPGSHRISAPSFCGACLNFYRDKDSAFLSLVDREV